MSNFWVDAVRYVNQELKAVRMGLDPAGGNFEPHETAVAEAVGRIEAHDTVHARLNVDGRPQAGPRLKVVPDSHGGKTLALDNAPDECLELADLERF